MAEVIYVPAENKLTFQLSSLFRVLFFNICRLLTKTKFGTQMQDCTRYAAIQRK